MLESVLSFLAFCFTLVNLPYTLFLIVVLLYWLSVILGALDLDLFNFDLDADVDMDADLDMDADVDADADADSDGDAHAHGGALRSILLFFNFGEVPVMIMISVLFFLMWNVSLVFTYYTGNSSLLFAAVIFVPNFLGSLFVAKFLTMPLRALFRAMASEKEDYEEMIGRPCVVITSKVDESFGQARIETKGSPLLINARTENGEILTKGEEALVVAYDPKKGIAIIHRG